MTTGIAAVDPLAEVNRKLDGLSQQVQVLGEQVQYLKDKAHRDARRQQEWDELKEDMTPIVHELYSVVVEQLEEIQSYVQLEDILFLLKRLARNIRTFNEMLDRLESLQDFLDEASPLTKDVFDQAVLTLNELEAKGYFGFARQSLYMLDQIVTSFSEEDVRLLGDNVVLILNTVKAMTQPEVMNLVHNLTRAFQEVEEHAEELPISFLGLVNQMRDADVRRGLAVTMAMLKTVSRQQPHYRLTVKSNGRAEGQRRSDKE